MAFESDVMAALGRIEQKIDGHMEEDAVIHSRHEEALGTLYTKTNKNTSDISRIKGYGAGVTGVMAVVMSAIGLDRYFGG